MTRTTVTDTITLGRYTARHAYRDADADVDVVTYTGPGIRAAHVRTWNAADRHTVLQALNEAFDAGADEARAALRRAIGARR